MNKMPGFTAEASLYKTGGQYLQRTTGVSATGFVTPSLLVRVGELVKGLADFLGTAVCKGGCFLEYVKCQQEGPTSVFSCEQIRDMCRGICDLTKG